MTALIHAWVVIGIATAPLLAIGGLAYLAWRRRDRAQYTALTGRLTAAADPSPLGPAAVDRIRAATTRHRP